MRVLIKELKPDKFETLLNAYGNLRTQYETNGDDVPTQDLILADLNAKHQGEDPARPKMVDAEIGRDMTRADIRRSRKRMRVRKLMNDIIQEVRDGLNANDTFADIKLAIKALVE